MLSRLTNAAEIAQSYAAAVANLRSRGTSTPATLRWRGGLPLDTEIIHFPGHKTWVAPGDRASRFRFHLGSDDWLPNTPAVEVNPRKDGGWQSQGAFGKDGAGNVYLCHTGRLGGGTPGISEVNLLQAGWSAVDSMKRKPGDVVKLAVIGPISARDFPDRLLQYGELAIALREQHGLGADEGPDD